MFTKNRAQKFVSMLFILALLLSSVHMPDVAAQGKVTGDGYVTELHQQKTGIAVGSR